MVARNTDAEVRQNGQPNGLFRRFLLWWQRSLTSALGHTRSAVEDVRLASARPRRSPQELLALRSPALAWAGGLAVAIGAAGAVALSSPGQPRAVALSAAAMALVWAAVRWVLLDVVSRQRTTLARVEIRGAWAVGSLVWVLGVTPELRALAWAASGALTWMVFERLSAPRRQAGWCVGIAWGAQAFVVVGSWIATNAIIAVLATRG